MITPNINFCLYYRRNTLKLASIKEQKKNKLVLLSEDQEEIKISLNQIYFGWFSKDARLSNHSSTSMLAIREQIERFVKEIDSQIIYELSDPGVSYSLEEMSDNFLDDPSTGWKKAALYIALKKDTLRFKEKIGNFIARSQEEIEEEQEKERKIQLLATKKEKEQLWGKELKINIRPQIDDSQKAHWREFTKRLYNFAVYFENSPEKKYFSELLEINLEEEYIAEKNILKCLQTAGISLSWGALLIQRIGMFKPFLNPLEYEEQKDSLDYDEYQAIRRDETSLEAFTVDNPTTRDYDDAISLEYKEESRVVRLHIADLTGAVESPNALFTWAEERFLSLYTLKETYHMFPQFLTENIFSLKVQKLRKVMTFAWHLNEQNEELDFEIYPSLIRVRENMSYAMLDKCLESEDVYWNDINEFCKQLKNRRIINKALNIERKEIKLDISNPENITLNIHQNTPSHGLVQELAIEANYRAAKICSDSGLPGIFRTQDPYIIKEEAQGNEVLTLSDINIKAAQISTEAAPHAGLGVECYMQITSPIRRFTDLIAQKIIYQILTTKTHVYPQISLLAWCKRSEERSKEYSLVERRLTQHWCYKYLAQNLGKTFEIEVIRIFKHSSLIRFTELQFIYEVALKLAAENVPTQVLVEGVEVNTHRLKLSFVF